MSEKIQLTFKDEHEEAQWWYDHREERDTAMAAAIADGTARLVTPADRLARMNATIRLDLEDAKTASELAQRRGLELQAYLKQIVHDALERERSLVA